MAQVRFEDVEFGSSNSNFNGVQFFNLKNDNEEAIVRIMHDSVMDFDILTTHEIRENGQYRGRVNCLRTPKEDLNKCPLCASGAPVTQRMYIHLIHYVISDTGAVVPQAKVWERSVSYANQIKSYIDNYGPMSDIICKIIRHGKPGDQKTRYEIVPNLNKQIYRDDIYVKDTSLFDGYTAFGNAVQNRSYEDLSTFVRTGQMPQKQREQRETYSNTIQPTPQVSQPGQIMQNVSTPGQIMQNVGTSPYYTAIQQSSPAYVSNSPQPVNMPSMGTSATLTEAPQLERPVRSYY